MATGDEIRLPLTSRDVHAARLAQFRELFPEASTEGKFDLEKLAQLLGDTATDAPERYGLSWAGKSEAIRAIQSVSPGTLLPVPEESWPALPFATSPGSSGRESAPSKAGGSQSRLTSAATNNDSENLIIEGDNLEVLKLLQGGYHGRVKMIYIDPLYNTGNEFIYPDNYKEGLADYLKFSRQVNEEGVKLATNTEQDGRYSSAIWIE
jgi:adenine-specific DNA-methyltransferase